MNLSPGSNFLPPSDAERQRLLLSAHLDGDLTLEEVTELASLTANESSQAFFAAISNVRTQLKAIPVQPVGAQFTLSVLAAVADEFAKSPGAPTATVSDHRRGWTARIIAGVCVAACALTLILVMRPFSAEQSVFTVHTLDSTASKLSIPGNVEEYKQRALTPDALNDVEAPERLADLQPYLESDDWRIVVVKVNSKDRDAVMRDIEALVARLGMNMRSVVDSDNGRARFGVLLTSTGVDDKDFVESVLPEGDTSATNWDADTVAQSSRETLIRRLQESMKTPTHSELHFGQVYLTLPKAAAEGEPSWVARSDSRDAKIFKSAGGEFAAPAMGGPAMGGPGFAGGEAEEPAPTQRRAADIVESSATIEKAGVRKPVLVVFEFTETTTHGAFDGRI